MGAFTPSGSTESHAGTTHTDARTGKSLTGFLSLRIRVLPRATAPDSLVAFPSSIACAPTRSMRSWAMGDCMAGVSTRSREWTTSRARTGAPLEKRAPFLIVNVYVLRSLETTG